MLDIEKTLQSVRDLLDRLGKEGVEFALGRIGILRLRSGHPQP